MLVIRTENSLPKVGELVKGEFSAISEERGSEILNQHQLGNDDSIPVAPNPRRSVVEMIQSISNSVF